MTLENNGDKIIDRYANEKEIYFEENLVAPGEDFKMKVTVNALNKNTPRAQISCIFTGEDIK